MPAPQPNQFDPNVLAQALNVQAAAGDGQFGPMMGGDATDMRIPLLYLDPLFDQILLMFPQDNVRELNRRLRHYYKYDPLVRSIIDFHTETPLSDFFLNAPESKEATSYYNDFKDRKNIPNMFINGARDYWTLGESFHYGNWDPEEQEYADFVQLPPEEIEVKAAYVTSQRVHILRPNRELSKTMQSTNEADQIITDYIAAANPTWAQAARKGRPFVLDNSRLFIMQREINGYSPRGISPMLAVVKDLMFQDFLNLFRNVFIQRHSYPLRIFKLGSEAKGFIPNKRMMQDFEIQLAKSINDPHYNLITHPFVNVETHTGHDKVLPLIPYYDLVKSRVMAGLFASESIVSGEKTPYAAGITFMRGLMNRYLTFRGNLENEARKKIWLPLAKKRGFYMPTQAEVSHRVKTTRTDKQLILPKMLWHKANLLSHQAIQQMLIGLREKGQVPAKMVYDMFGYDLDNIEFQFKAEEGSRVDMVWQKVRDDMLAKDENMAQAILSGKTIEEALEAKILAGKAPATEEKKPTAPAGKPRMPTPAAGAPAAGGLPAGRKPPTPTEGGPRPVENKEAGPAGGTPQLGGGNAPTPGTPSLPGERRPRAGETGEAGGGAGGGAAGGV